MTTESTESSHPVHVADVGAIGDPKERRAEWRVSVYEGRFGPKVDIRKWLNEPRPEDTRLYVPKGKGRGRVPKEPYVGPTKDGGRFDLADALTLATLILEAGGIAEQHVPATPYEGTEGVA